MVLPGRRGSSSACREHLPVGILAEHADVSAGNGARDDQRIEGGGVGSSAESSCTLPCAVHAGAPCRVPAERSTPLDHCGDFVCACQARRVKDRAGAGAPREIAGESRWDGGEEGLRDAQKKGPGAAGVSETGSHSELYQLPPRSASLRNLQHERRDRGGGGAYRRHRCRVFARLIILFYTTYHTL